MIALLIAAATAAAQAASAPPPRSAPAIASPATDQAVAAQIRQLEQDWGQAFVERDFAFLERIIAPEYRLAAVSPQGSVSLTYRDEWMRNTRNFQVSAFEAEVVEVATAGDTAVALVQGRWTVKRWPDRPAEAIRFAVADTWVRRNGRWQVVYRHSQRLPQAGWPPVAGTALPAQQTIAAPPRAGSAWPRPIASSPPRHHKILPPARAASYVSQADYPASALRNREQGSTTFRVTIGVNGRVTACTIIASSGSSALDSATCGLMQRRLRLEPARDPSGRAVEDHYESTLHWRLP